jgi:hypothetical protein
MDRILWIMCADFGQTLNQKVVDLFNTFPESIYSLILVEYSGSYEYWKFAVRFCEFQYSVNAFYLGGRLRIAYGQVVLLRTVLNFLA